MPAPEAADAAPIWAQISAGVVGFFSLCGMIWNGVRSSSKGAEAPEPASHVVMESASLADVRPFTERLDKIALAVEKAALSAEKSALNSAELLLCIKEWIRKDDDRRDDEQRDLLADMRLRARLDEAMKNRGGEDPRAHTPRR